MNTETIIAQLEQLNSWRRGEESEPQPDPKQVGEVIDAAIASLRSLVASNATLRNQRNDTESNLKHYVREAADNRRAFEGAQGRCKQLEADIASEAATRNAIIAKGVELERELQRVTAERNQYRDTLTAKHGGEPLALLSELDEARAELAALRQDKARLDWVEDFFARNTERSIIRQQFARDLRSIGFRAAINVAMKEVRHG